jgi:fimbrial isopeptide formation D2 family protein/LPXTG-motif cell wall-anchored protein
MKRLKKMMALIIAVAMVMAMSVTAFAATQTKALSPADADNATITINNPAKGETYELFKLFDATVSEDGSTISYQGTVPEGLEDFFTADAQGYIHPTDAIADTKDDDGNILTTKMTDELKAALEAWAEEASAVTSEVSDGKEALAFTGLPYGYYVVTTTHEDQEAAKALITVDSTKPNASIYDKNVNEPSASKEADKETYSIGDTITFTATFDTTNYMGEGEEAKQVVDYVIKDTLPPYLSDVTVTKITIGTTDFEGDTLNVTNFPGVTQFGTNKTFTIPWADKDTSVTPNKFTSKYAQGSQIVITYTATLTSTTNINAADTNTVSITPEVDNDNGDKTPWDESWDDSAEITTYAAAIHKVDENGEDLAGAQFTIAGLTVENVSAGVYRVVSYNAESTTASAVMDTDDDGKLYILGLASDVSLTVTEYKAPDGYNKLTETKTLTPQVLETTLYEASGTRKYDADGNLLEETATSGTSTTVERNLDDLDENALEIENKKGAVLPSTGGIGTTIFYVVGAILVIGAGIVLVTRRRMDA